VTPHDLIAGLSVAAVVLPVGVAYAQKAGFNPAAGLASIPPPIAYALFGTSRQLVVGPTPRWLPRRWRARRRREARTRCR
jgi:MFS superfamily sulfate permease-like transporter